MSAMAGGLFDAQACTISIVLVGADGSLVARNIDARTGGLGFSHAYLDPCRTDDLGRRWVIGYTFERGVHLELEQRYKPNRARAWIELVGPLGWRVRDCVRRRIGQRFSLASLVSCTLNDRTCIGLLVMCLPDDLRARIVERYECVSPNALAGFFDVRPGERVQVAA